MTGERPIQKHSTPPDLHTNGIGDLDSHSFRNITLALPTYNQADLLASFLHHFSTTAPAGLALLIVDDGSTDHTRDILHAHVERPYLSFACTPHAGAASARNHALSLCKTEWIAFTDTDCILTAAYFQALAELPQRFAHAMAVEGKVEAPGAFKPPLTHWLENLNSGSFATANFIVRLSAARAIGGFDAGFPSNLREDTDFGLRLQQCFGPIPFMRDCVIVHPFVPRPWKAALRGAWKRQGEILSAEMRLYNKHPNEYSLVRRLPNAQATLRWWAIWNTAFHAKAHWPWLMRQIPMSFVSSPFAFLKTLRVYALALILAAWEQCTLIWQLWIHPRFRNVFRLQGSSHFQRSETAHPIHSQTPIP